MKRRSLRRRSGMLRVIAISTPVMALMAACSSEEPARGQLMVALQSDMAIPKDFNRIRVQILVRGDLRHDGTYTVSPDGTTKLPATLAVVAGNEKNPPVEVRVIGLREREAQTFSKVITTVPRDRIATLHVPLQWLCQDQVLQVGDGTDALYESSCDPSEDDEEQSCVFGTCTPVHVDESELPTFNETEVFGGGRRAGDPSGQCFDVQGCFDTGVDVTPNLDDTSRSYCEVELDVPSGREASFAIRLPPGSAGICDETNDDKSCYVPLDKSERLGWRESSDGTRAVFPRGVCDRLRADPTPKLSMTVACDAKTEQLPTCGAWSAAPTAGVPRPPVGTGGSGGEAGATSGGEGGVAGGAGAPVIDAEPNSVWVAELLTLLEDQRAASGCSDRAGTATHTTDGATALANLVLEGGTLSPDEALSTLSAFGVTGAASYYAGQSETLPTLPEAAFADYLAELPCDPTSLGIAVVGAPGEQRAFAIVIAPCQDCGETCQPQCSDASGGAGGTAGRAGAGGAAPSAGSGGTASMVCTDGLLQCPDGCVNPAIDPANCGECGIECVAGDTCSGSRCVTPGAGGTGGEGGVAGGTAGTAQGGTGGTAQGGTGGASQAADCGPEPFDGADCIGEGPCPTFPGCVCDGVIVTCA